MGVVVRRYIDILTIIIHFPYSTCISSFFGSSIPTSFFILKMFFRSLEYTVTLGPIQLLQFTAFCIDFYGQLVSGCTPDANVRSLTIIAFFSSYAKVVYSKYLGISLGHQASFETFNISITSSFDFKHPLASNLASSTW